MRVLSNLRPLAERWREEAQRLRILEAHGQAAALEQAAKELNTEITKSESELLTIAQAAIESGYSEEHLRRLAREGTLLVKRGNGRRSRLRVRRGDLPAKQRRDGGNAGERVDYDPTEDARGIAKVIGGAV